MIALGIDPDLHRTGLALVERSERRNRTVWTHSATVSVKQKGSKAVISMTRTIWEALLPFRHDLPTPHIAVIEGQQIYLKTPARKDSILLLAQVAGAALGACANFDGTDLWMPRPVDWKGNVPKEIHQKRILEKCPAEQGDFTNGEWKQVVDAIGLACWGLEQIK